MFRLVEHVLVVIVMKGELFAVVGTQGSNSLMKMRGRRWLLVVSTVNFSICIANLEDLVKFQLYGGA